jgi:ubiquinone biosynthesis protein
LRGGAVVAIKLRRPGIEEVMAVDLAIVNRVGAWIARFPALRGVPVRAVLDHLTEAVYGQLDFVREAKNLARVRSCLAADPRVRVPRIEAQACRDAAIVMEFVEGLDKETSRRADEITRSQFAASALSAVYRMIFVEGFVHCDLHPGNLYVTEHAQVVVLDAGFSAQLTHRMRRLFADFFREMSFGHGARCAELVIESSEGRASDADLDGFRSRMAELVERNARRAAKDFSLIEFATEMFELQRAHHIHATPELLFPLLSLLVIEGTIRSLDPDIDFQQLAQPVVLQALLGGARPWSQAFLIEAVYP